MDRMEQNQLVAAIVVLQDEELRLRNLVLENAKIVLVAVEKRDQDFSRWKETHQVLEQLTTLLKVPDPFLAGPEIQEVPL